MNRQTEHAAIRGSVVYICVLARLLPLNRNYPLITIMRVMVVLLRRSYPITAEPSLQGADLWPAICHAADGSAGTRG